METARRQSRARLWLWILLPLLVPVALVCMMVFTSARDIHRQVAHLVRTPKLKLTWMQPSLTRGFWIEYHVQPDLRSGQQPLSARWSLRPWREVEVGKWYEPQ